MKKPLIGVLPLYDKKEESYWMAPGYMKGIEDAGGIPIMLPLTSDVEIIKTMANSFDGFLFTGGHDINPEMYGEKAESFCGELCSERDSMESILFEQVVELDKPAFGICRGVQLFNVLSGGTLYQDIPTQLSTENKVKHAQEPQGSKAVHRIHIERGNPLHHIINTESIEVNSYHHQGIKLLSPKLTAIAHTEDGLVEAVVMPAKKFIVAVQWHPELDYKLDNKSFKLFEAFVRACEK